MVKNYNMPRDVLFLHVPNRINKMAIVSKVRFRGWRSSRFWNNHTTGDPAPTTNQIACPCQVCDGDTGWIGKGGGVIINTLWWILAQQTTQDFTNHLLSPLPTRWVCTHTTVCRPASILNMEQSAESVETAEDLTTSPSASRLSTRCQPLAVSTQSAPSRYGNYMYNCNHSIFKFVFDQTFTTYKKL